MEKQQIKELLDKYIGRRIDPDELMLLRNILLAENAKENTIAAISEMMAVEGEEFPFNPEEWKEMRQHILSVDKPTYLGNILPDKRGKLYAFPKWSWVAASILLVVMTGLYFWYTTKKTADLFPIITKTPDIQPGRNGALLTLADGSSVSLDTIQNAVIALQGGVAAKVANGILHYEGKANEVVYNTMSTPRGRQFQLTLPDGTKVWLNAASSITYPIAFAGKERSVEVKGEVYFEVAQDRTKPFYVKSEDAQVEVLGTSFNMNVYDDEPVKKITLLEGKVRVGSIILTPNEQAQFSSITSIIKIIQNHSSDEVSWKNGLFSFHHLKLDAVMHQLCRWYDIDVEYANGVPDIKLWGEMGRDLNLLEVLKMLSGMGVHYRQEGRKIIILP